MNTLVKEKTKGYIMVFIAGILWGTVGLFVTLLANIGVSSSMAAFMRLFLGSLIIMPVIFKKGGLKMFKIDKETFIHCLILGIFSQALFNYSYNMAITTVGVATSSVLLYTAPVFVFILSVIFFKETIDMKKIVALTLNILGCFLMVTGGNLSTMNISILGIFFGIAAGFLYSLVTIIGKITSGKVHPFVVVFYGFLFGWITLGAIVRPWEHIALISNARFWLYSFGFGLIPGVVSYLLYMGGLSKDLEVSKVPVIASVETLVATLIGAFVFKESIGLVNMLGIAVLIFSIMIMNSKEKESIEVVSEGAL